MGRLRRFHPKFPEDLRAATKHFNAISPSLGRRFRQIVREKLEVVMANPDLYAPLEGEVHATRLPKFPYVLLYTKDRDHVYFVALVLGASDRTSWFERFE